MAATTEERIKRGRYLHSLERELRKQQIEGKRLNVKIDVPKPERPFLLEAIDTLGRPQQALYQLVQGIIDGDEPQEALARTWRGFTGDTDRIMFSSFLKQAGMPDGPMLVSAGFTGDVTADPLNFLPIGAASKFSKAIRVKLLATPQGREAMRMVSEAIRDAPLVGKARNMAHKWFITRPDLDPRAAAPFVNSVHKRLEELESAGLIYVEGKKVIPIDAAAKTIPIVGQKVKFLPTPKTVGAEAEELTKQVELIERMSNAHLEGRNPVELMADYLDMARKNRRNAIQSVRSEWVPLIGTFFRHHQNLLSPKDQELVLKVAEEVEIVNPIVRQQKLDPLLAQAKNPEGVMQAATEWRKAANKLEQMEEESPIRIARLGGALRHRRQEILDAATTGVTKAEPDVLRKMASTIRDTDFGGARANVEARALSDLMEQVASGNAPRESVLSYMEEFKALRGVLGRVPAKGLADLRKAWNKSVKTGSTMSDGAMLSGQDAFRTIFYDVADTRIAYRINQVITKRNEDLKHIQELLDTMPGYVTHYLERNDADALIKTLTTKNPQSAKMISNMGSAKHRNMIERKWLDKDKVPLSLEEIQTVLQTDVEKLAELGDSGYLLRKRTWKDILTGKDGALPSQFGLDPTKALAIRVNSAARAISGAEFQREVGSIFGNYRGFNGKIIPGFDEGRRFHPEVAAEVAHMQEAYFTPHAVQGFWKYFDGMQMVWKGFQLFPFVGYHTRNLLGDYWLMSSGGFFTRETNNPFWRALPDFEAYTDLIRAHRIQMHVTTGNMDALHNIRMTLPDGRSFSAGDIYMNTRDRGGIGIGFHSDNVSFAAEAEARLSEAMFENGKFNARAIPSIMKDTMDLRNWVMPSRVNKNALIRIGKSAAEGISNTNRLAFVMKRLRMGDSFDDAVAFVNRRMINYGELTPTETQVFRRLFPFYCVPDDSEILTEDGWLKVDQLAIGQKVLSMNHAEDYSEWVELEDIAIFPYNGQLMAMSSAREDFLCTWDHRWPVSYQDEGKREIVKAYELNTSMRIARVASRFVGGDPAITPRDAAIMGWVVTDGYLRSRGSHVEMLIYQSPHKYLQEIIDLLGDGGSVRQAHPDSGVVPVALVGPLRERIAMRLKSKEDFVTICTSLTTEAAEACFKAMMKAEGSYQPESSFHHFAQDPGPVLDAFQVVCQLTGRVAQISGRGAYVSVDSRRMKVANKTISARWYTGRVWCPKTKHGTWLMRRNGRIIWTGNTWTRKAIPLGMDAVLNTPNKVGRIGHVIRFIQQPNSPAQPFLSIMAGHEGSGILPGDEARPIDMPDWMRRNVGIPLQRSNDTGELQMMTIGAVHPIAELNRIEPNTFGHTFIDAMSPLLKLPLETAMGRNLFFDRPLRGTDEFMGFEMPAKVANAFQNVRLLADFDRMNWFSQFGNFSTRMRRPETDETMKQKWLRFFTGSKIYPLDTRAGRISNLTPVVEGNRTRLSIAKRAKRDRRRRAAEE